MQRDGYYAVVKSYGLTPTKVATVFRDRNGDCIHVPIPKDEWTEDQTRETLDRLRRILGIPDS
ncbi:hypothetical protein [Dongia sp.]|uniref:hypothetical protein n=1 Tax=Dongia sp. TaxID=1977262 RepID=UPI0037503022